MSKIDIEKLSEKLNISISPPTSPEDSTHRRWRHSILFGAVLLGVFVMGGICVAIVIGRIDGASVDDRKWATSILASMVTAGVGFLTGKAVD